MNYLDLKVPQFNQETEFSCIPACLQQVSSFYKKQISQKEILKALKRPERGMSIPKAAFYAKKLGFISLIITNNIHIFDPSWFKLNNSDLIKNLKKRKKFVGEYYQTLIDDYIDYLLAKGQVRFNTISKGLFTKHLAKRIPIIAELASNFLYKKSKSSKPGRFDDPIRGEIDGHGIVVAGVKDDECKIVDPDSLNNPFSKNGIYWISTKDLIASIFILEGKSLLLVFR